MQLNDLLTAAQLLGIGDHSVQDTAAEHPDVVAELKSLDPVLAAATFGGLLTVPELQANCLRLEALVHLSLAYANGRSSPTRPFLLRSFERLGHGHYGRMEDPSEDVFVALVNTPIGNFRIFEGVLEGNAFYLQRILNVVETMPHTPAYEHIRAAVYSLLKLSEAIVEHAGITENSLGQEFPLKNIPKNIAHRVSHYRALVRFNGADLARLHVDKDSLLPFHFGPTRRAELLPQCLGHTDIERRPLVFDGDSLTVVLPTAIGAAITRYVIEVVSGTPNERVFEGALTREYIQLISETPIFGERVKTPIPFERVEGGSFGAVMFEVDSGRFLNLAFFIDGLKDFDNRGFNGTNSHPDTLADLIDQELRAAAARAAQRPGFRDGISLLVSCGFGRGFQLVWEGEPPANWRFESISVHDLVTLGWLFDFKALSLWRLLDAQEALKRQSTELVNVNGLLNLVAWCIDLDGHLVPHSQIPEGFGVSHGSVMVKQNAVRNLRHLVVKTQCPRRALDLAGEWIRIRKFNLSAIEEENESPLYVAEEDIHKGTLRAVYLAQHRPWWLEIKYPEDSDNHYVYEHWNMLCTWLRRAAPVLDECYDRLPSGPLCLQVEFAEIVGLTRGLVTPRSAQELRCLVQVCKTPNPSCIHIKVDKGFDDALVQAENVAERAIVEAFVVGVSEAAHEQSDLSKRAAVMQRICPNSDARWMHRFAAQSFLDMVSPHLQQTPVLIDSIDAAAVRVGLGWRVRSRTEGNEISGVSGCTTYLNTVVETVLDDLCGELRLLDRIKVIDAVLQNYEAAVHDQDIWRRTSRALIALQDNSSTAIETILKREGALNAVFSASRILLEAAICECSLDGGGGTPGELDLSRMMSKAMMAFHYGGWSDAIYWGAMEPTIRITPLGDVHMKHLFMENIYEPFARAGAEILVRDAVDSYKELYGTENQRPSFGGSLEDSFLHAWLMEFSTSLDGFRFFIEKLEDTGLKASKPVLRFKRSDLISTLASAAGVSPDEACKTLDRVTMLPRPAWRSVTSEFKNKDWFPWRFRRRLSTLRRPFFQVDVSDDPTVIVAPGLVRQAFAACASWFYHGEIPQGQAISEEMRRWIGHANNVQRTKFNAMVESRMKELGWECEKEVKITWILGRSLDQNYGDIDVLAWQPASGRVLAMECKDLQFLKSLGEVAEQLSDFRGEIRADGKPDHLRRHLNRLEVLTAHKDAVSKKLKLRSDIQLEGHLVFRNPVPMQFAWEEMARKVRLSLFSELQNL